MTSTSIRKAEDRFVARLHEMVESGDPDFLDVYPFQSTAEEPDEPIREERHDTLEAALHCARRWGGDLSRFVNEGMVGHEYGDYLERRVG
jgi:hypothetical protein